MARSSGVQNSTISRFVWSESDDHGFHQESNHHGPHHYHRQHLSFVSPSIRTGLSARHDAHKITMPLKHP
ncbi:hypothetical protein ABK249_11780 [Neorhizobium sp. Rsf11]|uniref:Uncharacterized protein n=2 Tax=Neorhizobium TaxID=1525371 RepID=A0ABV0M173_9HYPH|nr:hypothetical protein [Neorhizobium petrolearium]MCC2610140.1 hypothetical protein [Neorhizobium petrolearium]WGI70310.1 hypothetical protein QEO92_09820 [Neorhizobium petrolearium]